MKQNCVKSPILRQRQATQGACNYPRHNSKVKFFLLQELLLPVFKNLSVIEIQVSRKGRGIGFGMAQQLFTSRVGGSKGSRLTVSAGIRKLIVCHEFQEQFVQLPCSFIGSYLSLVWANTWANQCQKWQSQKVFHFITIS